MGNFQPGRPGPFRGGMFGQYRPQEHHQLPNSPGYTPTEIQIPGRVSSRTPSIIEGHQYQTNNQNVLAGSPQQVYPQQYWPQGYPPQSYPPQSYPPQGYMPSDYPPRGYFPQNYSPFRQQGYPPQGYPGQQSPMFGLGSSPLCATCLACITCLMCSCCQALMGVPMSGDVEEDGGGSYTGPAPQVVPPPLSDD